MIRKLHNQAGSALLISLCLTMMLALIGIMAVKNSDTDIDLSFNQVHSDKAFYIAEAGAKRAYAEMIKDLTWNAGFKNEIFSGGAYDVTLVDSSIDAALVDTVIITSRGWTPDAAAIVEITVAPEIYYPFKYAMFADNRVDIKNSMNTDSYNSDSGSYFATKSDSSGDVGSNGVIMVDNGAFVGGDVATSMTDGDSVHIGATVTGTVSDDAPEVTLPSTPQSEFDDASAVNDNATGISGTYSYNPVTGSFVTAGDVVFTSGTYYFSSFILKNAASMTLAPGADVTIYVTGDIEIKNSGDTNPNEDPSNLAFYTQGDLYLKNSGTLKGIFYAPEGTADLRNSSDYYGSIAARDIVAHNSSGFHYDRELSKIWKKSTTSMDMVAWREL